MSGKHAKPSNSSNIKKAAAIAAVTATGGLVIPAIGMASASADSTIDCPAIGHQVDTSKGDPNGLDRDHDGVGCESYPGPPVALTTTPPAVSNTEKLPVIKPSAPATADPRPDYIVQPGDTLSGIAVAHGATLAAVEALNPGVIAGARPDDYSLIFAGGHVHLPADVAAPSSPLPVRNMAWTHRPHHRWHHRHHGGPPPVVVPPVLTPPPVTPPPVVIPPVVTSTYGAPVPGPVITGYHVPGSAWILGWHTGIDYQAAEGDAVHAAGPGTVVGINQAGPAYGNHVVIKHPDGLYTLYAHLSLVEVKVGDVVTHKTEVGKAGHTGNATGPHVHFEVRNDPTQYNANVFQDPLAWLAKHAGDAPPPVTTPPPPVVGGGSLTPVIAPDCPGTSSGYCTRTPSAWTPLINQAISLVGGGIATHSNTLQGVITRITIESSGNPNAVNLTDSNAQAGHPSKGLMQTIQSTFDGNHLAGTSTNIYDPLANICAALKYINAQYGGVVPLGSTY